MGDGTNGSGCSISTTIVIPSNGKLLVAAKSVGGYWKYCNMTVKLNGTTLFTESHSNPNSTSPITYSPTPFDVVADDQLYFSASSATNLNNGGGSVHLVVWLLQ